MRRSRKILLGIVSVIAVYLLLTPSAKLTTASIGPLLHTDDNFVPYGVRGKLVNLRPYPQLLGSFDCRSVKMWDAQDKLITDEHSCPVSNPDIPEMDRYRPIIPFVEGIDMDIAVALPSTPGTYKVQVKAGDAESDKLTFSIPDIYKDQWSRPLIIISDGWSDVQHDARPTFKIGTDITLHYTLTNRSERLMEISSSGANGCGDFAIVWDSQDRPVPLTEAGKRLLRRSCNEQGRTAEITLQPKETISQTIALSQLYDMRQPGKYTVQLARGGNAVQAYVTVGK